MGGCVCVRAHVFVCSLCCCFFSPCSLKSDSSDLSVLWFIEMYCWKCTGQGFLPTQAWSTLLFCPNPSLSLTLSLSLFFFPVWASSPAEWLRRVGPRGALAFYFLRVWVCVHRWCCWCSGWWIVAPKDEMRSSVMMSSWLRGKELEGSMTSAQPDRQAGRQTDRQDYAESRRKPGNVCWFTKEQVKTKQILILYAQKQNTFIMIRSNDFFIGISGVQESFGIIVLFLFSTLPAGM